MNPGVPLIRVEDTARFRLSATLSEEDAWVVTVGAPAQVTYRDRTVTGKVVAMVPSLDQSTRRAPVEIEVPNESELFARLRQQGIAGVEYNEKGKFPWRKIVKQLPLVGGSGVKVKDIVVFTRQFATMIDAGLPLVQCLDILGNQCDNPKFKKALLEIKGSVESGGQLCDGLRRFPDIFDELFCNLIEAGEAGGILDTILLVYATGEEAAKAAAAQLPSAGFKGEIVTLSMLWHLER